MKAIVNKSDLYDHMNILKSAKPNRRLLRGTLLTMTISDRFSVIGPGFKHSIDCEALEWGTLTVPYMTWYTLLQSLKFQTESTITLAAENGQIQLDTIKMSHPEIKVMQRDRLYLELPINPTTLDVLNLLSLYDIGQLRTTGIWSVVKSALEHLRGQLNQAAKILSAYGVGPEDLALPVSKKLRVKNPETFLKILFEELPRRNG